MGKAIYCLHSTLKNPANRLILLFRLLVRNLTLFRIYVIKRASDNWTQINFQISV